VGKIKSKVDTSWSGGLAYGVGLIASDGCLNKDRRHIWFSSKEIELINLYKTSLGLDNKIGKYARGGEKEKRYFCVTFGDINFYKFLNSIGLTSAKSKTIKSVTIPPAYFPDFVRGLFDGDGTFYTFQDKRWPNSFSYKLSFASASYEFLSWLKNVLTELYSVKGYFHKGAGVYNLEYVKGDSRKIFEVMYHSKATLFLSRKHSKIKSALNQDNLVGLPYLQKARMPE